MTMMIVIICILANKPKLLRSRRSARTLCRVCVHGTHKYQQTKTINLLRDRGNISADSRCGAGVGAPVNNIRGGYRRGS